MSIAPYSLLILNLCVVFSVGVQAQIDLPCHTKVFQFTPRHSLKISEFMGTWYMYEVASSDICNFPTPTYRCASRFLSLPETSDETRISAKDTHFNFDNEEPVVKSSSININNTRSPLNAMWYETAGDVDTEVIILFADNEFSQWAVVYSCAHLAPNNYRSELATAMTRSRTITPELRMFLKALMVGQGFRIGDQHSIDQINCPDVEQETKYDPLHLDKIQDLRDCTMYIPRTSNDMIF